MLKRYYPAWIAVLLCSCLVLTGCDRFIVTPFPPQQQSSEPSSAEQNEDIPDAEASSSETESKQEESDVSSDTASDEQSDLAQEESTSYPTLELEGKVTKYNAIFTVGDTGFEYYTYVPKSAMLYTALLNDFAAKMPKDVSVYSLIAPISSGITLPEDYADVSKNSDMKQSLELLYAQLSENVISVDVYENLMRHRDEYIYFRTDHHWTARGAYYAYAVFCEQKGITPYALTDYACTEFEGFLGSFYKDSDNAAAMAENPDTVEAFYPMSGSVTMRFTNTKGNSYDWPIVSNVEQSPASLKYSAFAGADNPYSVIHNPDITDGSTLVVVKESYANALMPFLSDHYATIYEIDYRYWDGNLVDFVAENDVKEVMFVNNISMTRSDYLIGKLSQILE